MASWWDKFVGSIPRALDAALRAPVRGTVGTALPGGKWVAPRSTSVASLATGGGGTSGKSGKASGKASGKGGGDKWGMSPTPTFEEAWAIAQQLMAQFGWDSETAMSVARSGGGGGGYGGGGGGGGGGGYIDTAARDAAIANVASTYANAEAGLKASEEAYRKISGDERAAGAAATAAAQSGAQQSYDDAVMKRALERRALGIEDAAKVGTDAVVTEKKIADDNSSRNEERMATRTQGHLDNNLKFNTDLRAVVNLEGKERQRDIADYYAGQLAQIAARRGGGGGGGGGGGYRGGGGGGSSRSRGLTPNQQLGFVKDIMNDATMRNYQRYGSEYNQRALANTQKQFPDASLGNQLSASKYLYITPPKKWI